MPDLPSSIQKLSAKDKTQRSSVCPTHKLVSSDFLGVQEYQGKTCWKFRCRYDRNAFYALPDKTAPKTLEEVAGWEARQKAMRLTPSKTNS